MRYHTWEYEVIVPEPLTKKENQLQQSVYSEDIIQQSARNHCAFFCTAAEVSFSNAAYGISRLLRAPMPIYKIARNRKVAMSPMKIPGAG